MEGFAFFSKIKLHTVVEFYGQRENRVNSLRHFMPQLRFEIASPEAKPNSPTQKTDKKGTKA